MAAARIVLPCLFGGTGMNAAMGVMLWPTMSPSGVAGWIALLAAVTAWLGCLVTAPRPVPGPPARCSTGSWRLAWD